MKIEEIKTRLESHKPREISEGSLKPAAVLMPLFIKEDKWHVLFTLRSPDLPTHQNQISFPGGHVDEGESAMEAALRETDEEVGISPESVEILGKLDEILTITRFKITPFVGVFQHPYELRISEGEISEVIEISLESLLDPQVFRRDNTWRYQGKVYPVYFFTVGRHTVWGATARIVKQFLELVMDWREPE